MNEEKKNLFKSIVEKNITRAGIDKLMNYLEKTDFYTAPASTKFHESYEGGLVDHSIKVYQELKRLVEAYKLEVSDETVAIISLFHDLCKVGCYKVGTKNVKDEATGQWHKEPFYQFEEDFVYGGHGSKSVYMLMFYLKLSADEAVAIQNHMGPENGTYDALNAFRAYPLAFLLHTADLAATIPAIEQPFL